MSEHNTKGPAASWTGAVDRAELASKAMAATIKLWDNCGSMPRLEGLAWQAAEAARAAMLQAQSDEGRAFKRLKDAQAQLALPGTQPPEPDGAPLTLVPQTADEAQAPEVR